MSPAEEITLLKTRISRLEESLRKAVRGDAQERSEAECDLMLIDLERPRPVDPAPKGSFFDFAASLSRLQGEALREPFQKPHFPA